VATFRIPGVLCRVLGALEIDSGTVCRATAPSPGPVAGAGARIRAKAVSVRAARTYAEHPGAVSQPLDWVGKDALLRDSDATAQCAELVKRLAHAPSTQPDNWQQGIQLSADNVATIQVGTPIATGWDSRGFYPNAKHGQHSGLFAGPEVTPDGATIGFRIVEQYSGLDAITSRVVYFDPAAHDKPNTYFYRATDYATIKW
jgi:hypothetical protein